MRRHPLCAVSGETAHNAFPACCRGLSTELGNTATAHVCTGQSALAGTAESCAASARLFCRKLPPDLESAGYTIWSVNTRCSHTTIGRIHETSFWFYAH